jgi:hypothetical protein
MKYILILFCLLSASLTTNATGSKKVTINTEADAQIFIDGKLVGNTSTQIKIPGNSTVNVRIEKTGFITQERNYVNDGKHEIPKSDYIKLEKDDAFESSFISDLANRDIDIRTGHNEDDSWRLISRIITNSFDVIQVTDKSTGYMCTAWVVKTFKAATVRTRLIIKTASTDPLMYKAKLVSEIAPPGTSASQDEVFKVWDRILRTFENVIPELQSRLAK